MNMKRSIFFALCISLVFCESIDDITFHGQCMRFITPDSSASYKNISNSPALCIKHCKEMGEPFALVKRDMCFCRHSELGNSNHFNSRCDAACPGDKKLICGGKESYVNIYETKDTNWEGQCARLRFSTDITPDYKGKENSPEKCRLKCGDMRFSHAGLHNGDECFCTDMYHFRLPLRNDGDDTCYRPCPGNTRHTCGGVDWANIYDTKDSQTTAPSTSTLPNLNTRSSSYDTKGDESTETSKLQLPLPMNLIIFLGVTVLVALIFLVIGVLHYCFWRKPPPPEDPPAFDMNMDYDTYSKGEDGEYSAGAPTASGECEIRDVNELYEGGPVIRMA